MKFLDLVYKHGFKVTLDIEPIYGDLEVRIKKEDINFVQRVNLIEIPNDTLANIIEFNICESFLSAYNKKVRENNI